MGNSSSRRLSTAGGGGSQDLLTDIVELYKRLISRDVLIEKLGEPFPEVRILVVGRSGCGKSSVVRALLGDNGPCSIVAGQIGEQDIVKEWRHPHLPLVIHDSNGIDSKGNSRMADIRTFLDRRVKLSNTQMSNMKFREYVHAVWYVFSAMDDRVLEDGGLLEMLDDYGRGLPLLLIMTNNDFLQSLGPDDVKVTPDVLDELLEKIKDSGKRTRLKESMVRVGNNIKLNRRTGSMMEGSTVDVQGMNLVYERTKMLMEEHLWHTWAACQVIDIMPKLETSSKFIVAARKQHIRAFSVARVWPGNDEEFLRICMLGSITHGLAKIWNAPKDLEFAVISILLPPEIYDTVRSLMKWGPETRLVKLMALEGRLRSMSRIAPTAAAAKSTTMTFYALHVMGALISAHKRIKEGQASFQDDQKLCRNFMGSEFCGKVSEFAKLCISQLEAGKWKSERVQSKIVEFFETQSATRSFFASQITS